MPPLYHRDPRNEDERNLLRSLQHEQRVLTALLIATTSTVDGIASDRCDRRRTERAWRRAIREAEIRVGCLRARVADELRPTEA